LALIALWVGGCVICRLDGQLIEHRAMTFGSQLGVGCNMAPSVLSQIAADFDATPLQGWISSGWLLSTCVAFIVAGRLSDIFGRRIIITSSNVLAIIGYAMCAVTRDYSVRAVLKLRPEAPVDSPGLCRWGNHSRLRGRPCPDCQSRRMRDRSQQVPTGSHSLPRARHRPDRIFVRIDLCSSHRLRVFSLLLVKRRLSNSIPRGGGSTVSASSCAR
jgi:hypothetical protein